MKFLQILLICFAWSVSGQSYDEAIQKADSMTRRYANQIFNKAGVVGVFYAGKDTIMAHGRINGLGRKADKDDVFQIGSVSKTITGLMFARALEEGWFQLDDSIAPFLDIKEKHRSKFDSVTFRQVVTHTAGLPNNTLDVLGPTFVAGAGVGIIKNQLILAPLGAPALVIYLPWHAAFVPPLPHFATYGRGSRRTDLHFAKLKKHKEFKYSNVGFGVLGNILARHYETNFEGLLQQEFCEPLGLKETSTQPKNLPKGSYATPHDFFGIRTVRTQFAEWGMEGAGDIKMSAKDLMVYLRMQFDNDHPMSSAVQFQQETLFEQDHPKHPEVAAVGIGWLKDIEEDGTEILWHHDHLLGSSAFIGFLPEKQIGIFILANNAKDRKLTKLGFWWLREQL